MWTTITIFQTIDYQQTKLTQKQISHYVKAILLTSYLQNHNFNISCISRNFWGYFLECPKIKKRWRLNYRDTIDFGHSL